MNNDFAKRLMDVHAEVERLKTVKDKASVLIETVENELTIELEYQLKNSGGFTYLESNRVLVRTWTENDAQPLVSMYFDGPDEPRRVFDFQRYVPQVGQHPSEMGFAVRCMLFANSDYNIAEGETGKISVPLKIVSTAPVQIATEVMES